MTSNLVATSRITHQPKKHHVFLSFRGDDTRDNFVSHLLKALSDHQIKIFIDYNLTKGADIPPALLTAIEQSLISIIIFSENYADSTWCLKELAKIMECKNSNNQIVLPVFYRVDPSHVRNQTGNFGAAFYRLKKKSKGKMNFDKARSHLMEAANISGWDSRVIRPESQLIVGIVGDVLHKLNLVSFSYSTNLPASSRRSPDTTPSLGLPSSSRSLSLGLPTSSRRLLDTTPSLGLPASSWRSSNTTPSLSLPASSRSLFLGLPTSSRSLLDTTSSLGLPASSWRSSNTTPSQTSSWRSSNTTPSLGLPASSWRSSDTTPSLGLPASSWRSSDTTPSLGLPASSRSLSLGLPTSSRTPLDTTSSLGLPASSRSLSLGLPTSSRTPLDTTSSLGLPASSRRPLDTVPFVGLTASSMSSHSSSTMQENLNNLIEWIFKHETY